MKKKSDAKKKLNGMHKRQSAAIPSFLLKTYEILENPDQNDIISWNEEGNAFIVKKVNEFSQEVLPRYFKHSNFSSFVRQLNMYDFHKTRSDTQEHEFKHRLFRRGYKNLLSQIKRKTPEHIDADQVFTLVARTNKQLDIDKDKQDTQFLMKEMINMRNKQENLEKVCSILLQQNKKMLDENKILWTHLIKEKSKKEKKQEKMLMWIAKQYVKNGDEQVLEQKMLNDQLEEKIETPLNNKEPQTNNIKQFLKMLNLQKSSQISNYDMRSRKGRNKFSTFLNEDEQNDIDFEQFYKKYKRKTNSSLINKVSVSFQDYLQQGQQNQVEDQNQQLLCITNTNNEPQQLQVHYRNVFNIVMTNSMNSPLSIMMKVQRFEKYFFSFQRLAK